MAIVGIICVMPYKNVARDNQININNNKKWLFSLCHKGNQKINKIPNSALTKLG